MCHLWNNNGNSSVLTKTGEEGKSIDGHPFGFGFEKPCQIGSQAISESYCKIIPDLLNRPLLIANFTIYYLDQSERVTCWLKFGTNKQGICRLMFYVVVMFMFYVMLMFMLINVLCLCMYVTNFRVISSDQIILMTLKNVSKRIYSISFLELYNNFSNAEDWYLLFDTSFFFCLNVLLLWFPNMSE